MRDENFVNGDSEFEDLGYRGSLNMMIKNELFVLVSSIYTKLFYRGVTTKGYIFFFLSFFNIWVLNLSRKGRGSIEW